MHHITILIIKLITCILAFALGLDLFFDATLTDILSFSILVTIISYIVGDRIILPRFGNTTASIADFLITYLSVWIFGSILLDNYIQIAWGSIISAAIITLAEIFVHFYLLSHDRNHQGAGVQRQAGFNKNLEYGTEFAEDNDFKDK